MSERDQPSNDKPNDAPKRYMRAYYHTFTTTGCDAVDAILEAVARAGKAYHNTSEWSESAEYGTNGPCHWEAIQDAADKAARAIPSADGEFAELARQLDHVAFNIANGGHIGGTEAGIITKAVRALEGRAQSASGTSEMERLKEIEHRAWHLLDDSEYRMDVGERVVSQRLCDELSELLPEGHPEENATDATSDSRANRG